MPTGMRCNEQPRKGGVKCVQREGHLGDHLSQTGTTWPQYSKALLSLAQPFWRVLMDHARKETDRASLAGWTHCAADGEQWPCTTAVRAVGENPLLGQIDIEDFDRRYGLLCDRLRVITESASA